MGEDGLVARLRAAGCVFAEDEARLLRAAATGADLEELVERRVAGEPLEHLLGRVRFCGRHVVVRPGVFVPRRRTQLLGEAALAVLPDDGVAVDLCCGTGAVGMVLEERAEVHAVDIDATAVRCARQNLRPDRVHEGDLYAALPGQLRGCVDLVVANAPYVPTAAIALMPPEARDHEARAALDGGADGLAVQRRVAAGAPDWLAAGGALLIETSRRQAPETAAAMERAGLVARVVEDEELAGTVVAGRLPSS
jgi:release factor glutamine methyltransferase